MLATLGDAWTAIGSHFNAGKLEFEGDDLATQLGAIIGALIVDEDTKGDQVESYRDNLHDCFPGYHVMVTQPKGMTRMDMTGLLFSQTKNIAKTTYRVFVFKSGTFHKDGDLGSKNWAYTGGVKSDDNHTVTFAHAGDAARDADWYAGSLGDNKPMRCEVAGVRAPNADMVLATQDGDYGGVVKNLLQRAKHCWPSYNILIAHDGGKADFKGLDSLKMADGSQPYRKKLNITNYTYWLYVFDKGDVTARGDGGWTNWAYSTLLGSTGSNHDRTAHFRQRQAVNLNPATTFANSETKFADPTTARCAGDPPDGDGSWPERIRDMLKECYPGSKILVVKSLNKITFAGMSGLEHVYKGGGGLHDGDTEYDGFVLNGGSVMNSGDGGYQNWAAYGADDGYPKDTSSGDHYMQFTASDDGDGEGGASNHIPDVGSNASTFTVDTGSGSFDTTQPKDSVATYVIKDGSARSVTVTSAGGSGLKYKMGRYGVSAQGSPSSTVTVNPSEKHQTVDGFGGAMTSSAAQLIGNSSKQNEIISKLFGTGKDGIGLSIARSPMGSSDLQASDDDTVHSYEDTKGSFSVDATTGDKRQISVLQKAKAQAGNDFKLLGTPWTAPGWAKKSGKLTGNECGTDENELDRSKAGDYAQYFANYVSAYSSKGLTPWMVSMQNEPENCKTHMPTTLLNADDEVALSKALKAKLPSGVGVLGWDHNWNDPDFVDTLTSKGDVDAIGYHCYDGTHYGAQTTAKKTLMTECSGFTDQSSDVAGNLGWEVSNLLIGPMRNNSTGSMYWSLAQDKDGAPHLDTDEACQNCRGLLTVNGDGSYTPSQDFYFYGQFSKYVRPGAVRVGSNNTGNLSTVAFKNPDGSIALVVLNSSTNADGGKAGSDESSFKGKIVQWDNNGNGQNPSWLVGADGYRRWISDISTYQCLKDEGGITDAGTQPGGVLDKYINLKDVWAVCGASVMGTHSELEKGTYLKSGGGARLALGRGGKLVAKDASGNVRWTAPATGDRLILQSNGNLVLYRGDTSVWSTGTQGKSGAWLSVRDDGSFIVSTKANKTVWTSAVDAASYKGQIVQWDGDKADQKTSWQVGSDGKRRVIHDLSTFQCLHDAGAGNSKSVSSDTLDKLPDLNNVWATCGADRLGTQGMLTPGSFLKAGDYKLTMQTNGDLVLWKGGKNAVWSTKTNSGGGHYLTLQSDGNLVQYDKSGKSVWSSNTNGKKSGWLVLGDDGSLRLYDGGGKQVWTR